MKIVLYDLKTSNNFGCPSILLGFLQLVREIYGEECKVVFIEIGMSHETFQSSDIKLERIIIKEMKLSRLISGFLFGPRAGNYADEFDRALAEINDSVMVVDLYGISLSDNFKAKKTLPFLVCVKTAIRYYFSFYAHKKHILSVKNTASFGPINSKYNRISARFADRKIFDRFIAREEKSREALINAGVENRIYRSPDVANLMPFKRISLGQPTVGISVSHQIIRQWGDESVYTDAILELCLHINKAVNANIVFIPNEYLDGIPNNDIIIANKFSDLLAKDAVYVDVLDVRSMTSAEVKNHIASCEMIIASRYHTCVAALSSGTPLITIGWHYKYDELMKLYNQDRWLMTKESVSSSLLIEMFDEMWKNRDEIKSEIEFEYSRVHDMIIDVAKEAFQI